MDTVQASYGDYLFTPNPASIAVADRRDPAVTTLPGGGWLLEPVRLPRQAALSVYQYFRTNEEEGTCASSQGSPGAGG